MRSLFDKLDLRPQERRLVVIVGIVVFVVLNFWLVFPMFGDYGRNEQRIKDFRSTLKKYQDEINKKPGYEKELKELETRGGYVPTEEAGLRLSTEVSSQAALSGVTITSMTTMSRNSGTAAGKTNAFFDEAAVTVNVNSGEKEFIDFLWRLADKETLIRAKSMQLGPDLPARMRLQGQITLVKSFQRRPPPRATVPTTKPAASSATTTASAPAEVPTKSNTVVRTNARPMSPPVTPTTGPKPPPNVTPGTPPAMPSPIPAPTPSGGTNRFRRALPTPARP
jgi:hypothetical protein